MRKNGVCPRLAGFSAVLLRGSSNTMHFYGQTTLNAAVLPWLFPRCLCCGLMLGNSRTQIRQMLQGSKLVKNIFVGKCLLACRQFLFTECWVTSFDKVAESQCGASHCRGASLRILSRGDVPDESTSHDGCNEISWHDISQLFLIKVKSISLLSVLAVVVSLRSQLK